MKNKINIGTASIILIFIILCLSVFALLSLSDARSAEIFAKRRADSVSAYYQIDASAQHFIRAASEAIKGGQSISQTIEICQSTLPEGASAFADDQSNLVCELPMSAGQSLRVELDQTDASVRSYYVYNSENYAIDNRLPVWDGQ
ncbi:MAG: hypothetical protein RR768_09520 [Clostridium sp.]